MQQTDLIDAVVLKLWASPAAEAGYANRRYCHPFQSLSARHIAAQGVLSVFDVFLPRKRVVNDSFHLLVPPMAKIFSRL